MIATEARSVLRPGGLDQPSPMHDLPSGVEFGTAVHAIFERVDPTAADLPAALRQACAVTLAQGPSGGDDSRRPGDRDAPSLPYASWALGRRATAL